MSDPVFISKSAELADYLDETRLAPHEAADKFARYANLQEVEAETKRKRRELRSELLPYVQRHGDFSVEGIGRLFVQMRGNKTYRLWALYQADPEFFMELLKREWLSVRLNLVKEEGEPHHVETLAKYFYQGEIPALMIERKP